MTLDISTTFGPLFLLKLILAILKLCLQNSYEILSKITLLCLLKYFAHYSSIKVYDFKIITFNVKIL